MDSGELSAWSEPMGSKVRAGMSAGGMCLDLTPGSPDENVWHKWEGNGGSAVGPWAGEKQPLFREPSSPGRGRQRGDGVPGAAAMETVLSPSPRQPDVSETRRPQQPLLPYPVQAQSVTEKHL